MALQQKIKEFFPWNESDLANHLVLCLDKDSGSGDFAFINFVFKFVRQNLCGLLISCNHGKNHYVSLFRKNVSLS
jgi:hypothetical protein